MRYLPQLATLVAEAPPGDEWLHELKYDGYRIGCHIGAGGRSARASRPVRLESRNGGDWTAEFPTVVAAARALPVSRALLDGELAVVLPDGRTSFQALQNARRTPGAIDLVYFVFDLLELDGEDLTRRPLEQRKEALRQVLGDDRGVIRYSDHVIGDGARFYQAACAGGLEGIVSKRRADPHRGGRSRGWLKIKCVLRQELVIGGFTEPKGSRAGLGALLVGVYEDGALRFAGKVGTGFTQASARALRERLDRLEAERSPFTPRPPTAVARAARWVRPELVAEVAFSEWTDDGKIRHPSFQGLREDKRARQVRRERPAPAPAGRRK